MGVFDLVTCRTLHFAGLKFIAKDFSYCSSLERSSRRMFASDNELIARYMSSAKSLTLDPTCSGRSFIYTRKNVTDNGAVRDTRRHRDAVKIDTINNN